MIEIVTMSSKGQVVIPKSLRKKAGLAEHDKFLVIGERGKIVLEKISDKDVQKKMFSLLDYFTAQFKQRGFTQQDIESELTAVRKQQHA